MQGAGGIRTDILHQDATSLPQFGSSIGWSVHLNFFEHFLPDGRLEREVKESRPGDFDSVEELLALREIVDDNLGNIVGRSLLGGRERHSDRGGQIPPLRPFRSIQTQLRPGFRPQLAFLFGPVERSEERVGDLFLNDPTGQEKNS
jgi:hypothetical protein